MLLCLPNPAISGDKDASGSGGASLHRLPVHEKSFCKKSSSSSVIFLKVQCYFSNSQ